MFLCKRLAMSYALHSHYIAHQFVHSFWYFTNMQQKCNLTSNSGLIVQDFCFFFLLPSTLFLFYFFFSFISFCVELGVGLYPQDCLCNAYLSSVMLGGWMDVECCVFSSHMPAAVSDLVPFPGFCGFQCHSHPVTVTTVHRT